MSFPDSFWQLIKSDYEINCYTFGELSKKYGIGKSTIHKRCMKERWSQPKMQQLIQMSVDAKKSQIAYFQELAVLYHKLSKAGKMKIVEELDKDGWLMDAAQYIFSEPREEKYKKMLEEISL